MKITIPATSANIGPGFDSVGVAVSKYLTIEILEETSSWEISHDLGDGIPKDEQNLLIQTALKVKNTLQPHRILMTSDIPLARGLGSSSSVIVAGIELANQLGNLELSNTEKLDIATAIEGHPDNVAPAIYGNLVISSFVNGKVKSVVSPFPETGLLAYIPNYELKTSESRGVLPSEMDYKTSVAASSIANVAIAALLSGDLVTAGAMIESDLFHETYRQSLIKEFSSIKKIGHQHGVYATYLSGAGPTVMILVEKAKLPTLQKDIQAQSFEGTLVELTVDTQGIRVEK
ncbi:Homoserine kinase [Streptococcus sp. DD10]|uniref:homoserine kinase n=1 Tax=Streptococcus sp. DD10 TaxID=1777878 RepID=UPI0007970703|nr:homoserine kinase [Streptococcus sp. DD10]KXT75096.1 Homoserine kinase [Streptococcus sp. DD10]